MHQRPHFVGGTGYIAKVRAITIATGEPKTDLVYGTSGLTVKTKRTGGAASAALTLADATIGAFTSSGFKHDADGVYEIGVPNTAFAAGAGFRDLEIICAKAGVMFSPCHIDVMPGDPFSETVDATLDADARNAIAAAVNDDALARLDGLTAGATTMVIDGRNYTITRNAKGYIESITLVG